MMGPRSLHVVRCHPLISLIVTRFPDRDGGVDNGGLSMETGFEDGHSNCMRLIIRWPLTMPQDPNGHHKTDVPRLVCCVMRDQLHLETIDLISNPRTGT